MKDKVPEKSKVEEKHIDRVDESNETKHSTLESDSQTAESISVNTKDTSLDLPQENSVKEEISTTETEFPEEIKDLKP